MSCILYTCVLYTSFQAIKKKKKNEILQYFTTITFTTIIKVCPKTITSETVMGQGVKAVFVLQATHRSTRSQQAATSDITRIG